MARPRKSKTGSNVTDAGSKANFIDDAAGPSGKKSKPSKLWKRLPSPEKSGVDMNQYRLLKLRNGVKVLLISRKTHANGPDTPWASVYAGSKNGYLIVFGLNWVQLTRFKIPDSSHSGKESGVSVPAHDDFKLLEMASKMNSSSMKERVYTHTPSTTSGVYLPISHAAATVSVEDFMGAFEQLGGVKAQSTSPPICSLSLRLGVGSHDDPVNFPGLAHLCEHLVHHGSEKFKEENGYHEIIEVIMVLTSVSIFMQPR